MSSSSSFRRKAGSSEGCDAIAAGLISDNVAVF
jgi:hypothetical protein